MKTVIHVTLIIAISMLLSSCGYNFTGSLQDMLGNLEKSLEPIWRLLVAFSYTLGIVFIGIAVMKLKQYGQVTVMMASSVSFVPTLAYFTVGVGLMFLPTFLDSWFLTAWAYKMDDISGPGGTHLDFMGPLTKLVQIIGLISFLRGWISLIRLGGHGQPGTLSKGLMHMVGGILAINITGTIGMLRATLGV
jgi:intracellular multiplication protein IcmC